MNSKDLNALLAEIRSARERGNVSRTLKLLAQLPPERRIEYAHYAGISTVLANTIHYAADFLERFDEDGEPSDPYWLIREAADLAKVAVWQPTVARIMRETLPTLPRWELVTIVPDRLYWCTGPGDLDEIAQRPTTLATLVREDSDDVVWVTALPVDEAGVDCDEVTSACWNSDHYGFMVYVQPSVDGAGWEVWAGRTCGSVHHRPRLILRGFGYEET